MLNNLIKAGDTQLPDPEQYQVQYEDVATVTKTEAGTTQRDVTRAGVVTITATWTLSPAGVTAVIASLSKDSVSITYHDPLTGKKAGPIDMYVSDGLQPQMSTALVDGGLWTLSATLKQY